jgi:hypothetical protein
MEAPFLDTQKLPDLWTLDDNNIPTNKDAVFQVLDYLKNHPDSSVKNPEWTKKVIFLLGKTDLSKVELTKTSLKTYRTFFAAHKESFPKSFNQLGFYFKNEKNEDQTRFVSKNLLLARDSDFFAKKFEYNDTQPVKLESYSESVINEFLNYLETGRVVINEDNVMELLAIARQYQIKDLGNELVHFLLDHLSVETFKDIWEGAIDFQSPEATIARCLEFAFKNREELIKTQSDQSSSTELLKTIYSLNERGVRFDFSFNQLLVSADKTRLMDALILKVLNLIFRDIPFALSLKNKDLNEEEIKSILEKLPHLNHLLIKNDIIKNIPYVERFNKLDCEGCTSLTQLTAPRATELSCTGCTSLTHLTAPQATELYCYNCTSLTQLTAPQATRLFCSGCTSLTQLTAPRVTVLYCHGCTSLTQLTAPRVTVLYCHGCTSLTQLTAPRVTVLYCRGCTSLTQLTAPQATKLACDDCTSLTQLTAPQATELFCRDCTSLTEVTVNQTTEVLYSNCPELKSIKRNV